MAQQLSTNTFGVAKWVVSPTSSDGTHTTIAAALTAASSGDDIFIRPGVYTENLTLKAGVNLVGFTGDGGTLNAGAHVKIVGKCTFAAAGIVIISNIKLETNNDFFLEVSGNAASIVELQYCVANCLNNTGINLSSTGGAAIRMIGGIGLVQTTGISFFQASGAGCGIGTDNYSLGNPGNSVTPNTISGAGSNVQYTRSTVAIGTTSSSSAQINAFNSFFGTPNDVCLTFGGSGNGVVTDSYFRSGTASAISCSTECVLFNCSIKSSNTNAVTGAGIVKYNPIGFEGTSVSINPTTQTPLSIGPRIQFSSGTNGTGGCQIMSGTGDPNGAVTAPKGSLYLRTDGGGVNDRAWINTNAGTVWTAIVTVA